MAMLAKDEAVEAEAAGGFPTALASVHDWDKDHQPHPFYQCILPLRCLLIKDSRPDQWAAIEVLCYLYKHYMNVIVLVSQFLKEVDAESSSLRYLPNIF